MTWKKIEAARAQAQTYPSALRSRLETQLAALEQLYDYLNTDKGFRQFDSDADAERQLAAGKLALSQMGAEVEGSGLVNDAQQFVVRAERWLKNTTKTE